MNNLLDDEIETFKQLSQSGYSLTPSALKAATDSGHSPGWMLSSDIVKKLQKKCQAALDTIEESAQGTDGAYDESARGTGDASIEADPIAHSSHTSSMEHNIVNAPAG